MLASRERVVAELRGVIPHADAHSDEFLLEEVRGTFLLDRVRLKVAVKIVVEEILKAVKRRK